MRDGIASLEAVTLHYRVMYGETVSLPMVDDGRHGDGVPGDGVYGATIPSRATRQGELVRYYVSAADAAGRASRMPFYRDPARSPAYLGTMVVDPQAVHMLPTLYWFTDDPVAAETLDGARASVYYVDAGSAEGDYYDNVFVRLRGWSSSDSAPWP